MGQEHIEDYLGVIYRLRAGADTPLPLARVQEFFNYSLISIHEMVQKLESQDLVSYTPYHGVVLTAAGEKIATALVRRHRIWERFLNDLLKIPEDIVHSVAGQLEHAAPELVTERLAELLGQPEACPHGSAIPNAADEDGTTATRMSRR
jgi:DtxR family transcriptional regulator, Mn-dependent transcriptional regulator